MKNIKSFSRIFLVGLVVFGLTLGSGAPTAFAVGTSTSSTVDQISKLLQQIQSLQTQLETLQKQQVTLQTELREVMQLTRNLSVGMSGDDVKALQELLASDSELYPEGLVTGFYGQLTARAVERLQERFGIEKVGNIGPVTQKTINRLFGELNRGKGSLNKGSGNIFRLVMLDEDEDNDGDDIKLKDIFDLSELGFRKKGVLVCHKPVGISDKVHTIAVGGPAVQAHLNHGDTLGRCDDDSDDDEDEDDDEDSNDKDSAKSAIEEAKDAIEDAEDAIESAKDDGKDTDNAEDLLSDANELLDDAEGAFDNEDFDEAEEKAEEAEEKADDVKDALEDSEYDNTAPDIDNVTSSSTASTTATISWDTDEDADSTVWYSTSSGFDTDDNGVKKEDDNSLDTDHSITLENLTPNTKYYFIVGSEDEAGNDTESSEYSFTTPAS